MSEPGLTADEEAVLDLMDPSDHWHRHLPDTEGSDACRFCGEGPDGQEHVTTPPDPDPWA